MDDLPEIAIRLGESDGFRRSQVIYLSDALAATNGELGILRRRLSEKDEQITEQSKTITELRDRIAEIERQ